MARNPCDVRFLLVVAAAAFIFIQVQNPHNIKYNGTIQGLINLSNTILIKLQVQNNKVNEALDLFGQMQTEGIKASQFTFASLLPVCNGPSGLSMGKQIHCNLFKSGLLYGYDFIEVSLLCTYLKLKAMRDANILFLEIPISNNKVLWTAVISGHTQNGYSEESLVLFQKMSEYYVPSDEATFSSVLKACADKLEHSSAQVLHISKKLAIPSCQIYHTEASNIQLFLQKHHLEIVSPFIIFNFDRYFVYYSEN